jgi:hypothetical protein
VSCYICSLQGQYHIEGKGACDICHGFACAYPSGRDDGDFHGTFCKCHRKPDGELLCHVFVCERDYDSHSQSHGSVPPLCFPAPSLRAAGYAGSAAMQCMTAGTADLPPKRLASIERLLFHVAPGGKAVTAVADRLEMPELPREPRHDEHGPDWRSMHFQSAFFTRERLARLVGLSALVIGQAWGRLTTRPHQWDDSGLPGELLDRGPHRPDMWDYSGFPGEQLDRGAYPRAERPSMLLVARRLRFARRITGLGMVQLREFARWAWTGILPSPRTLAAWADAMLPPSELGRMLAQFDRMGQRQDLARFLATGERSRPRSDQRQLELRGDDN